MEIKSISENNLLLADELDIKEEIGEALIYKGIKEEPCEEFHPLATEIKEELYSHQEISQNCLQIKREYPQSSIKKTNTLSPNPPGLQCDEMPNLDLHSKPSIVNRPFKCTLCSYRATQKCTLAIHFRTHTGERPFKCSSCSYRARQRSNLTKHLRTHSRGPFHYEVGENTEEQSTFMGKPFKCSSCPYQASKKRNLQLHLRTHTGEKPFKCKHCPYQASQNICLRRHIRTHTGERPFNCSHCSYQASQKISLRRHLKTHANELIFKVIPVSAQGSDESSSL